MSDQPRNRFDDLKEAYALGALIEDERREFEDYLAAHPELQAEVDELSSVANLLALAPQEYEPSPELRRNLLRSIGGATDASSAESFSRRVRLRELFGPGGFVAAATAAAVLAVVGLFVWNFSLRDENEDLRGELQTQQTHELQGSGAARYVRGEVVEMERPGRSDGREPAAHAGGQGIRGVAHASRRSGARRHLRAARRRARRDAHRRLPGRCRRRGGDGRAVRRLPDAYERAPPDHYHPPLAAVLRRTLCRLFRRLQSRHEG